ncbi:hypothetical protein GINT2_001620 [Glugoides intestinalis]
MQTPTKPILFGSHTKELELNSQKYELNVCDTSGLKEYIKLQEMSFLDADILVICVSSNDLAGLGSNEEYARQASSGALPVVLCLTKTDQGIKIPRKDIEAFVKQYKLREVTECTALDSESVRKVFENLIEISISEQPIERGSCFRCC